jgi:hypothetical protein
MKSTRMFVIAGLMVSEIISVASCSWQRGISGSYTTTIDARSAGPRQLAGKCRTHVDAMWFIIEWRVYTPSPDCGHVPDSDHVRDGKDSKVVFFGHAKLPVGTVDITFHGTARRGGIEGDANVDLHCLFGEENDSAELRLERSDSHHG